MQSARTSSTTQPKPGWLTPVLFALPIVTLLGIAAALGLFVLIGSLPANGQATAAPSPTAQIIVPTAQPALIDTPIVALNCLVTNTDTADTLIRSAPADDFAPLGLLGSGTGVQALGRTTTKPVWYAVGYAERRGWVAENVAVLQGDCGSLPAVRNPLVPDAPLDPPAHVISVDRDGDGTFYESISTPGGDMQDLVWVRVINLYFEPPNNFREYTLTLHCTGTDAEAVQWGIVDSPTMRCGDSMVFPFIYGSSDRPLTVQFAPDGQQGYIEYALSVERLKMTA